MNLPNASFDFVPSSDDDRSNYFSIAFSTLDEYESRLKLPLFLLLVTKLNQANRSSIEPNVETKPLQNHWKILLLDSQRC